MKNVSSLIVAAAASLLAGVALPGLAQAGEKPAGERQAPACAAPVEPTGALAPWVSPPIPLTMASGQEQPDGATLIVGQAAALTLLPNGRIEYPVTPGKAGAADSFGGIAQIDVPQAGLYRVALGSAAWVDVVRDGKAIASTKHGHGPACTGIRKLVDFPLQAGSHTLLIAGNGTPQTTILVAHLSEE